MLSNSIEGCTYFLGLDTNKNFLSEEEKAGLNEKTYQSLQLQNCL